MGSMGDGDRFRMELEVSSLCLCGLHAGGSGQMVVEVWNFEWQTSPAASTVTEQPYLGSALLTSHEEGPIKGGPNIVRSIFPRT